MHIGVLTHNYPRYSGDFSGVFIEALCQEYARQGHRVTVWAPFDPAYRRSLSGPVTLRLYRYAWPARLHRLGYMRSMQSDLALRANTYLLSPAFFAAGMRRVASDLDTLRPDALHAHWLLPNGFIAAAARGRRRIPLVVSVPGSDAQVAGQNVLFRRMAAFTFARADLLTANSGSLRDSIVELGADPAKFDLIIYGVDPATLRPDPPAGLQLRAELGIAPEATLLLCVGRMVYKKGFDIFLRALADPALCGRPLTTLMVGDGDQRAEWERLAVELDVAGRVRWLGVVPQHAIARCYNAADLLVMPSVGRPADGLNVCVLDAMSCARPVIGSTAAGNPLAIDDGVTGRLVPEGDPAALAAAIAQLADNPALRAQMGTAARRRVEAELGWPHLARRYVEHFERLRRHR